MLMLSVSGAMLSGRRMYRRFEGIATSILRVEEYTAPRNRVKNLRSKSEPLSHAAYASILKTEVTDSSEMLVLICRSTKLHFPEDVSRCAPRIFPWGRGRDPQAVYNLCLILKILLYESCCKYNTTFSTTAFIYIRI
jgi:hypothetical protein